MAVRIIENTDGAVLYCSTQMWAFGPVFDDVDAAETFLEWLPNDARSYSNVQLEELHNKWLDETEERGEPTDDEIYNRPGVEGGIGYSLADDSPGSLGENDWRL